MVSCTAELWPHCCLFLEIEYGLRSCVWMPGTQGGELAHFMCQFDWTTRHSDIWLNITSRCVCEGVSAEINVWISGPSEARCPPNACGLCPMLWRPEWNKRLSKREFILWDGTSVFSCLQTRTVTYAWLGYQAFKPDRNHTIGISGSLACQLLILVL